MLLRNRASLKVAVMICSVRYLEDMLYWLELCSCSVFVFITFCIHFGICLVEDVTHLFEMTWHWDRDLSSFLEPLEDFFEEGVEVGEYCSAIYIAWVNVLAYFRLVQQ